MKHIQSINNIDTSNIKPDLYTIIKLRKKNIGFYLQENSIVDSKQLKGFISRLQNEYIVSNVFIIEAEEYINSLTSNNTEEIINNVIDTIEEETTIQESKEDNTEIPNSNSKKRKKQT